MAEITGAAPEGDATRAPLAAGVAESDVHSTAGEHASTSHGHAAVESLGAHAPAGHGDHDKGAPLGPVDAQTWGAGILGVGTGLLVALVLYLVSYH